MAWYDSAWKKISKKKKWCISLYQQNSWWFLLSEKHLPEILVYNNLTRCRRLLADQVQPTDLKLKLMKINMLYFKCIMFKMHGLKVYIMRTTVRVNINIGDIYECSSFTEEPLVDRDTKRSELLTNWIKIILWCVFIVHLMLYSTDT